MTLGLGAATPGRVVTTRGWAGTLPGAEEAPGWPEKVTPAGVTRVKRGREAEGKSGSGARPAAQAPQALAGVAREMGVEAG
ncbi:MAG: hypothetical protein RMJ98_07590 [Myxococcales bacterium]|nr:hypothetical protein [Myxococcales bacterium]